MKRRSWGRGHVDADVVKAKQGESSEADAWIASSLVLTDSQGADMTSKQKTVIVTGASQGIGAGLVRSFLDRGYNVVANSRKMRKSNAFTESDHLALVDGSVGESTVARKIVETAVRKFGSIEKLGSLDRVARVVRPCVYLATLGDFFDHARVADAASELFRDVFGEDKTPVRTVLGVSSLPPRRAGRG